ncbi:MAG: tRNA modification GTPase [Candidatus Brocadiia bacterium]
MITSDTIAAVSTPAGRSARAVVRLSGPDALPCVERRFRPAQDAGDWRRTFRATRGELELPSVGAGVPVLLYFMRAPHSYTREDVAEFHLPGSPALLDIVLDDLLDGSVRLAEPGEFTRRAFLSGRIDLSQAEAVLAVIHARTQAELTGAANRLQGAVSRRCADLQERITYLRVQVEAALDFAPHGIELLSEEDFVARCRELRREVERETARGRGELARDGRVHVVIAGPPNAGKSSLLNRLAGGPRAIVHRRAGTTRDAVGVDVEVDGVRFRITDTAGLTDAAAGPDASAVEAARRRLGACHLLVLVLDGSQPLSEEALEPARSLPPERVVCVVNKCDLPAVLDAESLREQGVAAEVLRTSALTGEGVGRLRDALWRTVAEGRLDASPADCLFNARQREALRRAVEEVAGAEAAVAEGIGYEFAAVNLREATTALGHVTGQITDQTILDRIFNRFCIGK